MAIQPGRHPLGTDNGRIMLRTSRDGLVAQAGHDLTIEATRWSGELTVDGDGNPQSLTVTVDLGALIVRAGTGGVKPLSDRDKREIGVSARKVLAADRFPEATFSATSFQPGPDGTGGTISGTLQLSGQRRPQHLDVSQAGPGKYRATTTVRQTSFGIKPYSAFLGSLKVADAVAVEVNLDLSTATGQDASP